MERSHEIKCDFSYDEEAVQTRPRIILMCLLYIADFNRSKLSKDIERGIAESDTLLIN